jgi:major membrane immunogen (membrane-anchored lipoprotein)
MNATQKRSLSIHFVGLAFTVAALLGTASASRSQDLVRGTITLPVTARLGDATLAPGKYRFAVESLEDIRSVDALQIGNSRVAVIVSSLNKDGQVVSLVANAFRADTLNSQSPDSVDFGTGMTIRSISLKDAGVKVIFTTIRTDHILQATVPQPSAVRGDD